jgi:hypothetical protein
MQAGNFGTELSLLHRLDPLRSSTRSLTLISLSPGLCVFHSLSLSSLNSLCRSNRVIISKTTHEFSPNKKKTEESRPKGCEVRIACRRQATDNTRQTIYSLYELRTIIYLHLGKDPQNQPRANQPVPPAGSGRMFKKSLELTFLALGVLQSMGAPSSRIWVRVPSFSDPHSCSHTNASSNSCPASKRSRTRVAASSSR